MTAREIANLLSYVIVGLFAVAMVLFALSLQQLRRGRRGPYWRLRRQASQRGGVLFLASLGLFVIAIALAFYSGLAALAFRGVDDFFRQRGDGLVGVVVPTLTATLNVTPSDTPPPTETLIPTTVPTVTALPTDPPTSTIVPTETITLTSTTTPTPSATPVPTETPTASATVDSVLNLTPPGPGIAARASARIEVTAADAQISPDRQPVEPRTLFPAGISRIYLFITYQDMDEGVIWSRVLYRDGQAVQGQAYLWSQDETGEGFFFFGNEAGYVPGQYQVRLYLGDNEVSRFDFTVLS